MNVYAQVIIAEAERRGIRATPLDEETNLFRLEYGSQAVVCHESLTDRTPATAFRICQDKRLTTKVLRRRGFRVPRQYALRGADRGALARARAFARACGAVVVKPAGGEQGKGITVDVSSPPELQVAVAIAREYDDRVVLEEFVPGRDLRLVVIDHRFVAAIERQPATVVGDGASTVRELVQHRNAELRTRTDGESAIPCDFETERVIRQAGCDWDAVLPAGRRLQVRKTANFHTGGTITDVTPVVAPALQMVAEDASRVLNIPVVGLDLIVPDLSGRQYAIIEANERPGLANHEPQPVVERFIDFLFPATRTPAPGGADPDAGPARTFAPLHPSELI